MRKEIPFAIAILMGFLGFLYLEKPFRTYLIDVQGLQYFWSKHTSGIIVRTLLIVAALILIKKLQLYKFVGFDSITRFKNIQAVLLPASIILMGFISNWGTYTSSQPSMILLFLLSTAAVGVVEELVFRGTIFPLFLRRFSEMKNPFILSAILSSMMFGAVHIINIFSQPENIVGILSQIFFATSIGVFFCGLLLRTENILIPCIIHAFVNFSFSAGELSNELIETNVIQEAEEGINWASVIPTTMFFTFILLGGIYMIRKANTISMMTKLTTGNPEDKLHQRNFESSSF